MKLYVTHQPLAPQHCVSLRRRIPVVAAIITVACSASLAGGTTSQIYVYALRGTAARSWIAISCGKTVLAELKQGTYFVINEPPGQYMLSVEKGVPLSIDTRSGDPSFIRLDWNYGVGRPPIPVLAEVRQMEASREIKYLSYIASKRVHSSVVPKTDPSPPVQPQLLRRDDR